MSGRVSERVGKTNRLAGLNWIGNSSTGGARCPSEVEIEATMMVGPHAEEARFTSTKLDSNEWPKPEVGRNECTITGAVRAQSGQWGKGLGALYLRPCAAETLVWVLVKQRLADVFALPGHELGIADTVLHDCHEQFLLVLAVEGRLANQHLVKQHPKGPPINRLAVGLVEKDLWAYII